ncbi:MAG: hypothetical protein CMP23_14385 [Rickettsiales bacterium]|nr:hypothetical protein [Rickettsiales bacterium]|tara:strand:+ start:1181 stop:2518 length:1338 start_codon:yes stop_codon:yes gene_type:complete
MLKKASPIALLALACAGMLLGMTLTARHYDLNHAPPGPATAVLGFEGMCGAGGGCAEVNTSRYASISLGVERPAIPVSVPAVGFFLMLALLAGLALRNDSKRRAKYLALTAAACVPALCFALYLLAVQAFVISRFCPYCIALDAVTALSLGFAFIGHGGGVGGILQDLSTSSASLLGAALLVLLGGNYLAYNSYVGWIEDGESKAHRESGHKDSKHHQHERAPTNDAEALEAARKAVAEFIESYPNLEVRDLVTNLFDGSKGQLEGGIVVTEFADFDCPHCKLAGFYLKDIAHRYGDRVGFVFKNYPLGTSCNDNLKRDVHPDACEAAIAVQCGRRQGAFWPFHDLIFDHQGSLGSDRMRSIAAELQLNTETFEECLEKDSILNEVKEQIAQGRDAGLTGTPTFFVNGKMLPSAHPLFVEAAIRWELVERGETELPEDSDGIFPR